MQRRAFLSRSFGIAGAALVRPHIELPIAESVFGTSGQLAAHTGANVTWDEIAKQYPSSPFLNFNHANVGQMRSDVAEAYERASRRDNLVPPWTLKQTEVPKVESVR